jgi:hypothetical protein
LKNDCFYSFFFFFVFTQQSCILLWLLFQAIYARPFQRHYLTAKETHFVPPRFLSLNLLLNSFGHQKGVTQKLSKKLRFSKPIVMTIHWKALEEHFLMEPFIFPVSFFGGKCIFCIFLEKNPGRPNSVFDF